MYCMLLCSRLLNSKWLLFKFYFGGWCFNTQNLSTSLVTAVLGTYFQFQLQLRLTERTLPRRCNTRRSCKWLGVSTELTGGHWQVPAGPHGRHSKLTGVLLCSRHTSVRYRRVCRRAFQFFTTGNTCVVHVLGFSIEKMGPKQPDKSLVASFQLELDGRPLRIFITVLTFRPTLH